MKARNFSYVRARTLEEAIEAHGRAGDAAAYLSGGQSLIPAMAMRLTAPEFVIDLGEIDALKGVTHANGRLRIGALTRHAELITDDLIRRQAPLLSAAAPHVAHPAIRNRGTIGGSIALADPASELPAVALALGARIEAVGPAGARQIEADDFFEGLFQTALAPGEILTAIEVPAIGPGERFAFDELARRRGDYALVGAGLQAKLVGGVVERISIAFFSVGDRPMRPLGAEAALTGRALTSTTIAAAQAALTGDLDPPEDAVVPRKVRLHLARVLLGRLLGSIARDPDRQE